MDSIELTPRPLLRPRLLAEGFSDEQIAAAQRRADWQPIRPGSSIDWSEWKNLSDDDRHRLLVASTLPRLGPNTVVSHTSAARMHGLPIWNPGAGRDVVHVYRNRMNGGYRKGWINAHVGIVEPHHTTVVDGIPVTSVARTVVDCAPLLAHGSAVALADAALHQGLTTLVELAEMVDGLARRRGVASCRAAIAATDGRSESVGESLSRVAMTAWRVPAPSLQFEITGDDGSTLARTDFAWEAHRTVGEFDGRVKYGRLLKPGESPGDAVWREKLREDAVRDLGWEVVRWVWADLAHPATLAARILRAFDRASRSAAA